MNLSQGLVYGSFIVLHMQGRELCLALKQCTIFTFFLSGQHQTYNNQVFFPDEGNNDTKKHIRAFSITTLIHVALSLQFSVSVPSKRTRSCAYECVPLPNNPRSPPFLAELQSLN